MKKALLIFLAGVSCGKCPEKVPPFTEQEFTGREEIISYAEMVRRPVYQAKVPLSWRRLDPSKDELLLDTTKPLVAFEITPDLYVTVHNFPSDTFEERVPPAAQIERWQQQLQGEVLCIEAKSQNGFSGLHFEGVREGIGCCAWSMQLDLDHYQTLHFLASTVEEEEHYKQMCADYTIKVTGSQTVIEKHRMEIALFVESFGLIQEIPHRDG